MRIGLTYDLRDDYLAMGLSAEAAAEFDQPATIDGLSNAIESLGHSVDRIGHIKSLTQRLSAGDRWDLVFNIAEGLHGIGRESQVPALLDAYEIPYTMSDPMVCALTLHKATTKRLVRDMGLPTPDFAIVERIEHVDAVRLAYPLFAKPIAEGTSKGINAHSVVRNASELRSACASLLARFVQPVLVERFLPGREVTVGILGTATAARTLGVMEVRLREHADQDVYSYENKERSEDLVDYSLTSGSFADEASDLALRVWRGLGCRDAGRVDLRADEHGRLSFIEINPLPGLHPTHSDLPIMATLAGMSYERLIGEIVSSASHRMRTSQRAGAR